MKRIIAVALWTFAFWYLGSTIALFLGISGPIGPILGVSAGILITVDPRQVVWNRTPAAALLTHQLNS